MLMDLVSPLFPGAFVTILCIGSMARSVSKLTSPGANRHFKFFEGQLTQLITTVKAFIYRVGCMKSSSQIADMEMPMQLGLQVEQHELR